MKIAFRALSIFVFLCLTMSILTPSASAGVTGEANLIFGGMTLSKEWEPIKSQPAMAAEFTLGKDSWPVLIAIDLLTSRDSGSSNGTHVSGSTLEFDMGLRKIWGSKERTTRPFFGGGLGVFSGEVKTGTDKRTASDVGFWFNGGVFWRIGKGLNLGVDARYSIVNAKITGTEAELGGLSYGALIGWGW